MRVQEVIDFLSSHVPNQYIANEFPDNAKDDCGVVRVDGGDSPDIYVTGFKSPSIQVLIRNRKAGEAERQAIEIWNLFHGKTHYKIGNSIVHLSRCDQSEPVYIMRDKNGRTIYSVNVSCKVSE